MFKELIQDIEEAQECVHDIGGTPMANVITTCDQADMCLHEALGRIEAMNDPANYDPMRFEDWLLIVNEFHDDYDVEPDEQLTFAQFIDRLITHFCPR